MNVLSNLGGRLESLRFWRKNSFRRYLLLESQEEFVINL
jgi:hypothetical protein